MLLIQEMVHLDMTHNLLISVGLFLVSHMISYQFQCLIVTQTGTLILKCSNVIKSTIQSEQMEHSVTIYKLFYL